MVHMLWDHGCSAIEFLMQEILHRLIITAQEGKHMLIRNVFLSKTTYFCHF